MSISEFHQWLAWDAIEPIGEHRSDIQNAMTAQIIANVNRDPNKKSEPFTVDDFMVPWAGKPEPEPLTPEQELERWSILQQVQNAIPPH